jgi:hypothetical protein
MAAPSEYVLEPIRDSAEFTLYRARQHGNPSPLLAVAPTAEQPLPQSLRRLEHEYSLAAELEPAWAAKPLALTQDGQSWFSLTPAVSLSTAFLIRTGSRHSMWFAFYTSQLAWRSRSATSISAA